MIKSVVLHAFSAIIRNVMPLVAEAEIAALYLDAKYGIVIQNMLK